MRGAILPDALLAASLGLALGFSAPKIARQAAIAMMGVAVMTAIIPMSGLNEDIVFTGCWLSVLVTAALVHLKGGAGPIVALVIAANDGIWAGLVTHVSQGAMALVYALPFVLLFIPAAWIVGRKWGIGIKIAASWLIAIAFLEAALVLVPTPGYKPDHMD